MLFRKRWVKALCAGAVTGGISFLASDALLQFAAEHRGVWGLIVTAGAFILSGIIKSSPVKEINHELSIIANDEERGFVPKRSGNNCDCIPELPRGFTESGACGTRDGRGDARKGARSDKTPRRNKKKPKKHSGDDQ